MGASNDVFTRYRPFNRNWWRMINENRSAYIVSAAAGVRRNALEISGKKLPEPFQEVGIPNAAAAVKTQKHACKKRINTHGIPANVEHKKNGTATMRARIPAGGGRESEIEGPVRWWVERSEVVVVHTSRARRRDACAEMGPAIHGKLETRASRWRRRRRTSGRLAGGRGTAWENATDALARHNNNNT